MPQGNIFSYQKIPMQATYEQIRERYPNPSCRDDGCTPPKAYCVGGALCLAVQVRSRFPFHGVLRDTLIYKYGLEPALANQYAYDIVKSNDAGLFEVAWGLAKCALALCHQQPRDATPHV